MVEVYFGFCWRGVTSGSTSEDGIGSEIKTMGSFEKREKASEGGSGGAG
jgi:hypothetical protein